MRIILNNKKENKMLNIKVKGLFDVLSMVIGVNDNELETSMQIEYFDLSKDDQEKITKILNAHVNKMSASDLIRKLQA